MPNLKNIVIGGGLIASNLGKIDFGRPVMVLASGVSDSTETRAEAFAREIDVVERSIAFYSKVHAIYCSTCSVDSGVQTPYTLHKLNMEKLVMATAASCNIFRLPQIVGLVHNRTLVSHFVQEILGDQVLRLQSRASRNLLDVRDFARVAGLIVRRNAGVGQPQNIASSSQVPVVDIVAEIARLMSRSPRLELIDGGYTQEIDIAFLSEHLAFEDPLFGSEYWREVLRHYVPFLVAKALRSRAWK